MLTDQVVTLRICLCQPRVNKLAGPSFPHLICRLTVHHVLRVLIHPPTSRPEKNLGAGTMAAVVVNSHHGPI
jgi:hypothetical protein